MKCLISTLSFALLLLLISHPSRGQSWQWGNFFGSGGTTISTTDIQVDAAGNTYALVELRDGTSDVYVGGKFLSSQPKRGLCLVSHDPSGIFRWAKVVGSLGSYAAKGRSLRVSRSGKVFVFGDLSTDSKYPIYVDVDTMLPVVKGIQTTTLICYDTGGKFQWLHRPDTNFTGSKYGHESYSMDIDENDNVYCLVSFPPGNPILGTSISIPSYVPPHGQCLYVLTYAPSGALNAVVRLKDFNRTTLDVPPRLTYNRFNKGFFVSATLNSSILDSVFIRDVPTEHTMFLGAYLPDGTLKWYLEDTAKTHAGSDLYEPVRLDANGDIYFSGTLGKDSNQFAGYDFSIRCGGHYHSNPFVVKLDSNGKLIWGTNGGPLTCYSYFSSKSTFAISDPATGVGIISGQGWGDFYLGDSRMDTLKLNYSIFPTEQSSSWYAILDLTTGKTLKLATIQGKVKSGYWDVPRMAFYKQSYYYLNATDSRSLMFDSSLRVSSKRTATGSEVILAKYDVPLACATSPIAMFSRSGSLFTFTGTSPHDSVTWDFGDGDIGKGTPISHSYKVKGKYMVCVTVWTAACGSNSRCVTIDVPVALEELAMPDRSVTVSPNPVRDRMTISGKLEGSRMRLTDIFGRLVWEQTAAGNSVSMDVSEYAAGVYLLQVTTLLGETMQSRILVL